MKLFTRKLEVTITLSVILVFLIYFVFNRQNFEPIRHLNLVILVIVSVLNLLSILSSGIFTKIILLPFKKNISVRDSFFVSLISSVGNFFAPAGAGFGFRALYLKKKFNLSYSSYISTLAGNYVIVFLVDALAGLTSLYLLRDKYGPQYVVLLTVFIVMLVCSLALMMLRMSPSHVSQTPNIKGSVRAKLRQIMEGWSFINSDKTLVCKLFGLTAFNLGISILTNWLIITALHFSISFPALVLFSVLGSMSLFINLTPANLGVKEAVYIFSAGVYGFSTGQVLSIALVDRGVLFIVLFVLWMYLSKAGAAKNVKAI